jgi:hypothetical protein
MGRRDGHRCASEGRLDLDLCKRTAFSVGRATRAAGLAIQSDVADVFGMGAAKHGEGA